MTLAPAVERAPRPVAPRRPWRVGLWMAVIVVIVVFTGPVLWVISISLRPETDALDNSFIPKSLEFANYSRAMDVGGLLQYMTNSVLLGVVTFVIVLPVGFLAGYALARFKFFGRNLLMVLFMFSLTIPGLVNLIGIYKVFSTLHLIDNRFALAFVYAAGSLPMATWLFRSYVRTLPRELEEAAWLDGCTRMGGMRKIVVRLSGPSVASVGLIVFVSVWQEFFVAQSLLTDSAKGVVSQGLYQLQQQYSRDVTGQAAASVIISVVPVLLFVLLQRRFVGGIGTSVRL